MAHTPFSVLRNRLSPEARARVAVRVKELLAEMQPNVFLDLGFPTEEAMLLMAQSEEIIAAEQRTGDETV
jgi:hypothetical protein